MSRWRKRLGESGAEQMLRATIEAGMKMKAIRPSQLLRLNVDTTVQTKAIRYPTDARSYHRCRERLVDVARLAGLKIKQSYEHVGSRLLMQSSRYAHARQMKRAKACTRTLRTQLGRVLREIERQVEKPEGELKKLLETARKLHAQQRHDKKKIYSVHEPEVECIAKGKAGKKYEYGNKVRLPYRLECAGRAFPSFKPLKYSAFVMFIHFSQTPDHSGSRGAMAFPSTVARGRRHCGKADLRWHPGLNKAREPNPQSQVSTWVFPPVSRHKQ
jgi:hypothetical protein